MDWEERTMESEVIFSGRIIKVRRDRVAFPGGGESTREIVEHRGAVVIVPVTDQGEVIMVRQYRKAAGQVLLELPAGTLEEGEPVLGCAKRELKEETGLEAGEWQSITQFYSCPGFCTEKLHLFLAKDLSQGEQSTDPDERIVCLRYSLDQAMEMARRGEIADAKTLIGLFTVRYWYS